MALNQPEADALELSEVIEDRLDGLVRKLRKENFDVSRGDLIFSFFDRQEYLAVKSEVLYPGEYLPLKFGVHRGYAGGGIHSGLQETEFYELPRNRQAKAERVLGYFRETFWGILQDADRLAEEARGEKLEVWEKVAI